VLQIKDLELAERRERSGWFEGWDPHPQVFLEKSSDLFENKRVEFFVSAKECGRISNEGR
jgi:hypothetical protein